ncbi:MAG: hypothetical protein ABR559_02000 [Gemmatimonadota bacterium]
MKRSTKLWVLGLALAASFAPLDRVAGQDPQFTFTVPVEYVSLMPEVTTVRVACKVFNYHSTGMTFFGTGHIGVGSVEVPVSPGQDLVSEVTVTVNVDPDRHPSEVRGYVCAIPNIRNADGQSPMPGSNQYPWSAKKPGTVLTIETKGTIP